MIVQSAPEGQESGPRFVMKLEEHLELVGQLAENFGNDAFETPGPREHFLYACRWHDKGWKDLDDDPPLDPKTGLPYNLVETPIPIITLTGCRSPEYNEAHHAYCGLLDSMHIWGLYNGRYGLSDKVLMDHVPEKDRLVAQSMLDTERQRQKRLTTVLEADPDTAPWVEEDMLFNNYKALQFFDTFALYFNCTHAEARGDATYANVPRSVGDDVDIKVRSVGEGTYSLDPYPFAEDGLEVSFAGRHLTPFAADDKPDMAAVMRQVPLERQTARLVAA
jgi:hypothetical protein